MKIGINLHQELLLVIQREFTRIKYLALIASFLFSMPTYSKNLYFSSSTGNDSYTSTQAQNPATPWKTIDKLNSSMSLINPGDSILFKRGDLFTGTLKITRSGSSSNHIILSAYETGEAPILNGFNTINGWTSEGNSIYSTSVLCESRPNMVTINGINTPMGRYPDSTWLSIDSYITDTSITDEELPVSPDWDGAEVVIRKNEWVIDRSFITDHTNHTITYNSGSSKEATDGYGYFIQNDFKTLTTFGEWYYNSLTHILYMYFGTNVPDEYEVNVSSIDDLIYFSNSNYITIDGLSFRGANKNTIHMLNNDYITIQNCNINFSGFDGIYGEVGGTSPYCVISNNNINHSNNTGISLGLTFTNAKVTNNRVRNSGVIAGMGGAGSLDILDYQGIHTRGDNILVQYNVVENTGYCGINFFGSNVLIANNFVNNFSLIETDAGGIYTADYLIPPNSGQIILNNIVLNGIGATAGAKGKVQTFGIYIDDNSSGTKVSGNTIVNCRTAGIFVHNAHEIEILNNTSYNNGNDEDWCGQMLFSQTDKNSIIRNIVMRNNKFISKDSIQNCLSYLSIYDDADIIKFGTADSNFYARPIDDDKTIMTAVGQHWIITNRNLTNWKSFSNQDANSHKSPTSTINANSIIFEFNASITEKVISLNKPMIDVKGTKYQNSITLSPYSSIVLMVDPDPSAPPATPLYVSSAIENAAPSVLEINYNLSLANIVPAASAFTVQVNSAARSINSVAVSGTKVILTLSSAVAYGNTVTFAYTKPSSNPLQTTAGGQAASLGAQSVLNKVGAPAPVYTGSVIENATPSKLEMTYNLSLANTAPSASAFSVRVNNTARAASSAAISGSKVILTLASSVAFGDVITVAYTKPATNPVQSTAGGQAAALSAQPVTNKLLPLAPAYISFAVENASPSRIDITFNLSLANIAPAPSSFTVNVNTTARTVNSVTISGTKVLLTLASAVINGDVITVAYTKPSLNPVQTAAGGQTPSFTTQSVANRVGIVNTPPVIVVNYKSTTYSGFVSELDATASYDANKDNLTFIWVIPDNIPVSSTTGSKIQFLSPIVSQAQKVEFKLNISDGKVTQTKSIPVDILPYQPELEAADILNVEASSYQSPNYPYNILDGNIGTMWSVNGDNQWLILELKQAFSVQHVKLAFQNGQKKESYFDILGSEDKETWEPIMTKENSCAFSGNLQVFEFPSSKTGKEFKYIKLIGRCNSVDTWNYISEFKIFGFRHINPTSYQDLFVKIYPNPANEIVNILIDEPAFNPDFIKIVSLEGKTLFTDKVDPGIRQFQIPVNFKNGVYIVEMGTGEITVFTQKLIIVD
jgi:uncharacterized repeat protein (TIGR02059 family)